MSHYFGELFTKNNKNWYGIWDQTIQDGTPPESLLYGTEYAREQIDEALQSSEPLQIVPSVDENSHGTFLASIAAGSVNEANQFIGAAPDATIAVVKLKFTYYNG